MKRKAVKYKLAEEILASVTGEKTKSYVAKAPAFQFLIPCGELQSSASKCEAESYRYTSALSSILAIN